MMKKIIGFIICMLLIASAVYPVIGNTNLLNITISKMESNPESIITMQSEIGERDTIDVWTKLNPSFVGGELGIREFAVMVYDSGADRTILFGGADTLKYNDTWAYDYNTNTWTNRSPNYSDGTLSFRSYAVAPCMAYDPDADCTILFGGYSWPSFVFYDETWAYNYTDNVWVNRSPNVSGEAFFPRTGCMMAYYDSVDRMIMFGGVTQIGGPFVFLNDTWEYNYNDNKWANRNPTVVGSLPKMYSGAMVYDSGADCIILFGGADGDNNEHNETWVYCYSNNTWWERNPDFVGGTLSERALNGMVYDSGADRTILFGGQEGVGGDQLNETWVYNYSDNTWYKVNFNTVGGTFYPKEAMGLAYDSSSDKTVLACGFCDDFPGDFMNDTWVFTYNYENNQEPETPEQPTGPTNLNPDEPGTYTTSATDPDDDQVQYQFDWDSNGDHDYSDWTGFVSSDEEASLDHSWSEGGSYIVKARARDFYGDISGWSTGLTVVVNSAPNSPSNPEPTDGATDVDVNADLSWDCSDPEGDSITYDVYFEADDPTPDILVSSKQSEKWFDPGIMEYNTDYYWKIVAWDKYGASTEGPVWCFTTGLNPNNPPNPPSNPSPEDNATDVDVEVDLIWECNDPDGDNVTFDVYLDVVDPPEEKVSDDQSETAFDPGTLEFVTTYYWQVVAKDEHGASTPGIVWQFTTRSNNPPESPTIDGPDKGKPGTTYEFGFTAIEPDDDEIGEFIIKWGDDSGEELITGPFSSGEEAFASHAWSEKGSYTIQAKAKDVYGAECSAWGSFVISIPRNRATTFNPLFYWFFERFPMLERLLSLIYLV